jgi:hypothetical protein
MGDALDGHELARRLELQRKHERKEEEVAAAKEQRSGKK